MTAIVVYQSLYGATAAFAAAIAQGIGPEAKALSTSDAPADLIQYATLVVVGSPVHIRGLPSALSMRIASQRPRGIDRHGEPLVRDWLETLPHTGAKAAAFDTKVPGRLSGKASGSIAKGLAKAGFDVIEPAESFLVEDHIDDGASASQVGDDELARARAWGASLAAIAYGNDTRS